MTITIIGSQTNPKVRSFREALQRQGKGPGFIVSYSDLYRGRFSSLKGTLRFESPGREPEELRAVYEFGAEAFSREGKSPLTGDSLTESIADRGLILPSGQFYLGLTEAMNLALKHSETGVCLNDARDIALCFHKEHCQRMLKDKQVPVPQQLGNIASYEQLLSLMKKTRTHRVFVKLCHGSAASGIATLEIRGTMQQARSTTAVCRRNGVVKLYNTRKVQIYRDPATIRTLIDELARLGAYGERWYPKASFRGHAVDLRVITVGGNPTHFALRGSKTPFTNLHLEGVRWHHQDFVKSLPENLWAEALDVCRRVAGCFPKSLTLGIDLAVSSALNGVAVLEVNGFGDFIKDLYPSGQTPYDAQVSVL